MQTHKIDFLLIERNAILHLRKRIMSSKLRDVWIEMAGFATL